MSADILSGLTSFCRTGCLCSVSVSSLITALVSERGSAQLQRLFGDKQTPPALLLGFDNPGVILLVFNTLRAVVYAARAGGKTDEQEKRRIEREIAGLSHDVRLLVHQFLSEDLNTEKITHNIVSVDEALWIYALSCSITRAASPMERGYLDQLAQSLSIPDAMKAQIERRATRQRSNAFN